MVLERDVEIRLRQVPGVIRLGKEAKVGQLQIPHQRLFFFQGGSGHPSLMKRVGQSGKQKKDQDGQISHE